MLTSCLIEDNETVNDAAPNEWMLSLFLIFLASVKW